ncbi:lactonase family protein [Anaerosacchariphilus polymeriproducens]|uniref:Lactonase family protein n=1 Tax=Anaerosacchariphilus polymeriproducens TaxID=1812858 RepID=A0A371AUS5_9FIRM|nr:lactonase family protein [Anaerosacchariphilus polymeriproducens]RDU23301.1 lactonase family protein [Anaerosacchariphilus polymeriproducens]
MGDKYVAYVGTYTHGDSKGIYIYDMDIENGRLIERKTIPINNASYIAISNNKEYLYSICDMGVEAYKILPDGDLEKINERSIEGMRGCHISTDAKDEFLFVAGYHDGKVTVLRLREDGGLDQITDGIFHKGLGTVTERNLSTHISSVTMTPDQKYLLVVDMGVGHVKIYGLNRANGKLKLVDILRCELDSQPRFIIFSNNGKYAYLNCEAKKCVHVYSYEGDGEIPKFELIQTISTISQNAGSNSISIAMKISEDGRYLYCTNAGNNSVTIFEINQSDGTLQTVCSLPISGDYPKDVGILPNNKYIVSLNHESNQIMTFAVDYENKYFSWKWKPISIETPNCIKIIKVKE